jgi:hypothetical protein
MDQTFKATRLMTEESVQNSEALRDKPDFTG